MNESDKGQVQIELLQTPQYNLHHKKFKAPFATIFARQNGCVQGILYCEGKISFMQAHVYVCVDTIAWN